MADAAKMAKTRAANIVLNLSRYSQGNPASQPSPRERR
jgi:hypothetical protein